MVARWISKENSSTQAMLGTSTSTHSSQAPNQERISQPMLPSQFRTAYPAAAAASAVMRTTLMIVSQIQPEPLTCRSRLTLCPSTPYTSSQVLTPNRSMSANRALKLPPALKWKVLPLKEAFSQISPCTPVPAP
jgi:hypothetical protein